MARAGHSWFVDLSAVRDPGQVEGRVAAAVSGLAQASPARAAATLTDLLEGRNTILLLDNCEQVVDACADVASRLLAGTHGLLILATSREPLGIAGETTYYLGPMTAHDATRLFVERARARVPAFLPLGEVQATIEQICTTLDGMPLAIELAAGKVGVLSPAQLLPLLTDRFGLLTTRSRNSPDRHRALRPAIDWSYDLLDPLEQRLFRRMAVFEGSFDLSAAAAMCDGGALDTLGALVDKSLVIHLPTGGHNPRYRLLETLREYGLERLRDLGELDSARTAHLWHFVATAEATFSEGLVSDTRQLEALEADLDNVLAALSWSVSAMPDVGTRLLGATRDLWFLRSQADGLRLAQALLMACPSEGLQRTRALLVAGQLANTLQLHDEARGHLTEAHAASQRLKLAQLEGWSAYFLGVAGFLSQDAASGRAWLSRSTAVFASTDDRLGLARATISSGTVQFLAGALDAADARLREGLAMATAIDDSWGQGLCHTYLGMAAHRRGDDRSAVDHLGRAVSLLGRVGDITIMTIALAGLAISGHPRDRVAAVRLASAARVTRERIGGAFAPLIGDAVTTFLSDSAQSLGKPATEAAIDAGRRLSMEEMLSLAGAGGPAKAVALPDGPLSPREFEVAKLLAQGLGNQAIAVTLHLSVRTVENHVSHILAKLALNNRTEIAAWQTASYVRR